MVNANKKCPGTAIARRTLEVRLWTLVCEKTTDNGLIQIPWSRSFFGRVPMDDCKLKCSDIYRIDGYIIHDITLVIIYLSKFVLHLDVNMWIFDLLALPLNFLLLH